MIPCPKCLEYPLYNERYDAYYCPTCDKWQSNVCDDSTCFYCVERPEKPSLVTKDLKIGTEENDKFTKRY